MYELRQVGQNSFYLDCPSKIGLVRLDGQRVCLIDSGSGKEAARRMRQHLDANGWKLEAVYNTHGHADHIGGNQFLQDRTGCALYAPGVDCCIANDPILDPAFLYGGYPYKELRSRFLMAQPSGARPLTPGALPAGMSIIPLPGHCFDQVGFRTADDVVYLADCLCSPETLEKYQISYLYDVAAYVETLKTVAGMKAAAFVPSHAPATGNIAPLALANLAKVEEIAGTILDLCGSPITFEALLRQLFRHYRLTMDEAQYVLLGSTVRSYLAWLRDSGRVTARFEDDLQLWQAQ